MDVSSLCRPFLFFSFFLFLFFVSGISLFSLFENFFLFFWGGKSEQDRHSITKSSRTRVSNPQEIPIFYSAQPHLFCSIFVPKLQNSTKNSKGAQDSAKNSIVEFIDAFLCQNKVPKWE